MGLPALPGVSGYDRTRSNQANGLVSGVFTTVGPGKAFAAYGPLNATLWGERTIDITVTAGSLDLAIADDTGLAVGDAISSSLLPPGAVVSDLPGGGVMSVTLPPQFWAGRLFSTGLAAIYDMGPFASPDTFPPSLSSLVGATIIDSPYFAAGTTVLSVDQSARKIVTSSAPLSVPGDNQPVGFWFAPAAAAITGDGEDDAAIATGAAIVLNGTFNVERSFDGGSTWLLCNIGGAGQIAQFMSTTLAPVSLSFGEPEASVLYRFNAIDLTPISGVAARYRFAATGQASRTLGLQVI